jgi:hypothetical protein
MRKRTEHVIGGTLMHEHLQTAFGSGRIFGDARPIPHARVNLVELDGVVPRRFNPDPQDVRVLSASSAWTDGNGRFGWEDPIATPNPGRLHIELVASSLVTIGAMVRSPTRVDTRLAEFVCENCHV